MNEPSQMMLSQSETRIVKTLSATDEEKSEAVQQEQVRAANAKPEFKPVDILKQKQQQKQQEQRLQLYNSLFGQDKNKICQETALHLTSSLNYSLITFLHLTDKSWVLAMIDVESFAIIKEKYGQSLAQNKLNQIGIVIRKFCDNDPNKLKGFKCNDDDDNQLFAMLLYCHPQIKISEKYISKLLKQVTQQTNELVYVGIAKMNEWESFDEWKQRAFDNLKNAKSKVAITTHTETTGIDDTYFSDIDVKYVNPTKQDNDEKQQQLQQQKHHRLGNKEEFDVKMQEIANNEDYEWIAAIMAIDDFSAFVFSNDNKKEIIEAEITKLEKEMYHLFDIYGNGNNKNEMKYFGYKISRDGSTFGLILYDSKDINKCFVPAHEILETLSEEINMKCRFTVCIGSSRLIEDDLGMTDDWIERIYKNVKRGQRRGKNEVCFGDSGCRDDDEFESKLNEDDMVQSESLKEIEKYGFAAAVQLNNVKIIANDGILANENDFDVKVDYDPTKACDDLIISYKQIFFQTLKFIMDNNCNGSNTPYLKYPKLYLNNKPPQCNDKQHCKQCYDNDNTNNKGVFFLCSRLRRRIGDELFDCGEGQECATISLRKTAAKLFLSDRLLIKDSNDFALCDNWFAKVYAFLIWQQEAIETSMHHLVCLNISDDDSDNVEHVASNGSAASSSQSEADKIFFSKFELLTLMHSYLDQLIEYLLLYYCCFESKKWISVFYPFIEYGIGTKECNMLFAAPATPSTTTAPSVYDETLKFNQINDISKEKISCEMKAVCIFKRILFDVCTNNGKIGIFKLMNKIGMKLKQTTNSIKSQMLLNEINNKSNGGDDKKKKDDWSSDTNDMTYYSYNLTVPSFVRLFVIRRIIAKYISDSNEKHMSNQLLIEQLVNIFDDNDKLEFKETATVILTRLINDGIKTYMSKWYNEREECDVIEKIFNKIILKKFETEYNQLITYQTSNNNFYQDLVFNSSDLMPAIFEYLEWGKNFNKDLFWCSVVNSHWFYHVWNVNSVYEINSRKLVDETLKYNENKESNVTRLWQRLIHAKCLWYHSVDNDEKEVKLLLNKLCMLRKIEKVNINMDSKNWKILKAIMSKCKESIRYCDIRMADTFDGKNKLSPLKLTNVRQIVIRDLYFYRIWTNKCTELKLWCLGSIKPDWCQFVIKNCDCSSINNLTLHRINFDDELINKSILSQLASKFINLKQLIIQIHRYVDSNVLIFWQLLNSIVSKNNGTVELEVVMVNNDSVIELDKILEDKNVKISKLTIGHNSNDGIDWIKERDGWGLNYVCISSNAFTQMIKLFKQVLFKSITVFEINGWDVADLIELNHLLGLNVIVEKELFVIVKAYLYTDEYDKASFILLCLSIIKLFAQQIPIDIQIEFDTDDVINYKDATKKLYDSYLPVYSSYFENEEFLSKYNKPKCNVSQLCLPRVQPWTYWSDSDDSGVVLRATNVQL